MIEFVGLPPHSLESYKGCYGNHAFSHSPFQNYFVENFVSHSEGPSKQFGMNLKGPRSVE